MNKLSLDTFNELLKSSTIRARLKSELRFVQSTESLSDEDWYESELLPITERSTTKGVLIIESNDAHHLVPYELKRGITSGLTGRAQPVLCDLCRTWQTGSRSGSITFPMTKQRSISYLCCADLRCSAHVRSKTAASKTSRSQLREDMTTEQRVERLRNRLSTLLQTLQKEQ